MHRNLRKLRNTGRWFAALALLAAVMGAARLISAQAPQADAKAALASADRLLAEMSKTVGLPIKAPLEKALVSRAQIREYLTRNLHAEYSADEMHAEEAALKAFGLAPGDFNLEQFLIKFYTEQAAGFYDPHTKTMYMADWIDPQMQETVLAHELTHALQDQNFDLTKFLHAVSDDDDAVNARQAVVEGHAMAAMLQHQISPSGVDLSSLPSLKDTMASAADEQLAQYPTFTSAPYFFRLQALFPYLQGMEFMQRGLAKGGWAQLARFFAEPPATTKELFQPEYYFEHKLLPKIALPPPAPLANVPGLRLLTQNTMGELGYFAIIGQLISEDEAKAVASDWLADRYVLHEYSNQPAGDPKFALVARTKWSSAEKAQGFFRDYQKILQKKYPMLAPDAKSTADLLLASVGESRVILLRDGDEVRWCENVPAAQAEPMLRYLNPM